MSDMIEAAQVGGGLIDDLLGAYAPSTATFEVSLPKGEVLTFRAFSTYSELASWKAGAAQFVKLVTGGAVPPAWQECLPQTNEEAIAAYTIAELSVEPKFSQIDAMRLLKAPWLVEHIMGQIDAHRMACLAVDRVDDAKKG